MATYSNTQRFIDAVIIHGQGRKFACTINMKNSLETNFVPFDLSDYNVEVKVLGAASSHATPLVTHLITPNSNLEVDGQLDDPINGKFTVAITKEDTLKLGVGKFPIQINILNADTGSLLYSLTEGGEHGEFNKIYIVQV